MSTTHLTDFIPTQVLEREGFVHTSDNEKMLNALDKRFLADHGWHNLSQLRPVRISMRKAAEIIDCSASTLAAYVKMGYLAAEDGQVLLSDALTFDYPAAKAHYLAQKQEGGAR